MITVARLLWSLPYRALRWYWRDITTWGRPPETDEEFWDRQW